MNPSESELRAEVTPGQDEAPEARRRRRRTVAAVGGAVVAVLAVGGIVAGIQLSHTGKTSAGSAPTAGSTPTANPTPAAPVTANCPTSSPALPGGSSATNEQPLFPSDVTAIRVCGYHAQRPTGSKVIDGAAARSYAQRFNELPTKSGPCPLYLTQTTIALLPSTPRGTAPAVVGQIGGCGAASNGTAFRATANNLLNELARDVGATPNRTVPIPTLPSHVMTHGPVSS